MGQPQKLPLWRNRRRSQNSPIFARPKKESLWNFPRHRHRRASRWFIFILAFVFGLVIFATASQVIFLLRADEEILVPTPDMRLQKWFGFERVYGYYDDIVSLVPSFKVMPAGYLNESIVAPIYNIDQQS
ncbi:hypothetical protein N431DRAFT_554521 [Stipitochalara longipes BDJ]|nr:hypothetical protein N431DRAFT_554521 [Stipitochalara longipes BDJ]